MSPGIILRQFFRFASNISNRVVITEEIRDAIGRKRAIVALESTVITHGLPYPENLRTAESLESIVRDGGAVPATIALLNGRICVGLTKKHLERLAKADNAMKVSTREIPYCLVKNAIGGTTVAATMHLAHCAGIGIFATGGIGGVHRGAGENFDISADLIELGRTPVTVICAGIKSILDTAKTLEFLETHSVNVMVYRGNSFPGFFTADSGCKAPQTIGTIEEIVKILRCKEELMIKSGTMIACPIPREFESTGKTIEEAIQKAIAESSRLSIAGQQLTPFLLQRVNKLTQGLSLATNIALLENNARIATEIAMAMEKAKPTGLVYVKALKEQVEPVDIEKIPKVLNGGTLPGAMVQRCGGVARNHADALTRLGISTTLVSAIGDDSKANFVEEYCSHMVIHLKRKNFFQNFEHVAVISKSPTAAYLSVAVKGIVQFGIFANPEIIEKITPELIRQKEELISVADMMLMDANLTVNALETALQIAKAHKKPVWFDPTDLAKAAKLRFVEQRTGQLVDYLSPNANEFVTYCRTNEIDRWQSLPGLCHRPDAIVEFIQTNAQQILHGRRMFIVTLGKHGTVIARFDHHVRLLIDHCSAPPVGERLVSVSGAGDCFNCGLMSGILYGLDWEQCLELAQKCALLSLLSRHAVPDSISRDLIQAHG